MGRRKSSQEPGLLDMVLGIAWASPLAGVFVSTMLLLVASVIRATCSSTEVPMTFVGAMLAMVAIAGLLVSGIALLRDVIIGRW